MMRGVGDDLSGRQCSTNSSIVISTFDSMTCSSASTSTSVSVTARSGTHSHVYYKEESVIGNGAYGTVYRGSVIDTRLGEKTLDKDGCKLSGRWVALKKVRIPLSEDGVPVSILREIGIVKQLDRFQHPNIVRFLDVCSSTTNSIQNTLTLYLVFEYIDMDLATYIQKQERIDSKRISEIMWELLSGVDFLHAQRLVHRDLKPQNLLISSSTGQLKLADFGLAKIYDFSSRLTTIVVTLWYRSPEVLLGSSYGSPVDLWSVGCILAELYRKKPILAGDSEKDQLNKTFDILGTPCESDWPVESPLSPGPFIDPPKPPRSLDSVVPGICTLGVSLLQRLLTFNPFKRISAKDALQHKYFKQFTIGSDSTDSTTSSSVVVVLPTSSPLNTTS